MHPILAARTDFSVGESILTVEKLVEEAKKVGAKVVALTDTMSVTGLVDFTTRAKKADLRPIIGCRLRISMDPTRRLAKGEKKGALPPEHFLTVYARTEDGLKSIYRLLTKGAGPDRFYYKAKIGIEDLYEELEKVKSGHLSIVLGDTHSVMMRPDIDTVITELQRRTDRIYAPFIVVNTPYFARLNELSIGFTKSHDLPLIAIRPALYEDGGADAHEVMGAVVNGNKLTDPWHLSAYNRDFHIIGESQLATEAVAMAKQLGMRAKAVGYGAYATQALKNTDVLVDEISYAWTKQKPSLPVMAPDEFAEVVKLSKAGWAERFTQPVFDHKPTQEELDTIYRPRLAYELSVLKKLNFSGYFLLVHDVVQYAKTNGILVGPGRGSVGGSLVAYLMGITDCDPIRFGLLFERFINPDRLDLPDADLDFMSERRHEVVDYLIEKYGAARVAGVSNFGTLAAASTIRDVGKALMISEREYSVSKLAPKAHGANIPLPEARKLVSEIDAFATQHEHAWPLMERLEGTIRNFSQHAAGIVVAGCDLVERAVVEQRKETSAVVCWDKRIVEEQGLIKMDILGLSTLDLINLTLSYIRRRHSTKVNLMRIPLDDPKVLENFAQGRTVGIFQFESGGMRRLLKELGADGVITFDDITAATALYRPGPMESGMMDSYYKRKQGHEPIEYDHELMEPILSPTFGVMVYQEQVMQVSRAIAGYSAPDADKLRKIMGKKLPEEMKKERGKFVDGCVKTVGATERWAGDLFDKIEGFAGYGFNKSHSVEYTLISYQSMWLKTHYPIEFYAAALTLLGEDKLPALLRDAKAFGLEVGMPDINLSSDRFEIASDTLLVIPFQRIKGISTNTATAILEARKAGPFKDKADFINRVEKRKCHKGHQEALDKIGAFARIEPSQPPSVDPSRTRDQIELIPGLVTAHVIVERDMHRDKDTKSALLDIVREYRIKHGPGADVPDGQPIRPNMGRTASVMLISDAPNAQEEEAGTMGASRSQEPVYEALDEAGLSRADVYWTALIKRAKAGKQVSADEITTYSPYLVREIKLLRPPVIVLLGTSVLRTFLPGFEGKAFDGAGKVVYSAEFDCNIVVGFNPGEIYYAPEKQEQMNEVMSTVATLLTSMK